MELHSYTFATNGSTKRKFGSSQALFIKDLHYQKSILVGYFHLHISATAIPRWIYQFSFDHWSQATSGPVSTWMGDRLGTPGAVGFLLFSFEIRFFSGKRLVKNQINSIINQRSQWPQSPKIMFCEKKIICIVRESNPGRPRGRRAFYHWTNVACMLKLF